MDSRYAARLLEWFAANRRDLPWRGPFPRDPYRVLVSEVMLQQTQVERVAAGFGRFLERFPTVAALAAAAPDEVVAAFHGLGYYGRARRLHQAAAAVAAAGGWPRQRTALAALPGLGPYTAAAVAAFAFAGADPPVDGNVARVAARVLAAALPAGSPELLRRATALARELHDRESCPELYEALIELGATVCRPRRPRCPACPLAGGCAGRGDPGRYPVARRQRSAEPVRWVALWLERADGQVLLRRVPDGRLLAGLWLPPLAAAAAGSDTAAVAAELAAACGFSGPLAAAGRVRHTVTHHRIEVASYRGRRPAGRVAELDPGVRFCDPASPGVPTSSLLGKLAGRCAAPRPAGKGGSQPESG